MMNLILRHIAYLTTVNDCVIVPGWGAFLADYLQAELGHDSQTPPVRSMVFNPDVTHNDGLLVASVARREGMSYEAALARVNEGVRQMRRMVDSATAFTIPRVGTFTHGQGDTLVFEPSTDLAANAMYGALPTLNVPSTAIASGVDESAGRRLYIRPAHWVAAASIAAIVSIATFVPFNNDGDTLVRYASLSGGSRQTEMPVRMPAGAVPDVPESLTVKMPYQQPKEESSDSQRESYYLIVASFETRRGAQRFIDEHPGRKLDILQADGRYRIYIASASTRAELEDLDTPGFASSWIYEG